MNTDIEIVTGFLGSGKTSFINALVESTLVDNEKVLIIQCERGLREIQKTIIEDKRVKIKLYDAEKPLTEEYLKYALTLYRPHRVIIEHNGTRNLIETLNIFNSKALKKHCKITTIFYISEASVFNFYLDNMGGFLLPAVEYSNLILINNINEVGKEEIDKIHKKIDSINPYAIIIGVKKGESIKAMVQKEKILEEGFLKKLRIFFKNIVYR
ncbi:hypothetical protein GCM10008905_09790 [Clostridium malenominatum]|uniref:CobW/HypB/UreG nucleotide-binding domain-containing protein n=1 Tax=Clostridium malenominatum TaxID=1539 RepID=A0ABN1ISN6_9CLOT